MRGVRSEAETKRYFRPLLSPKSSKTSCDATSPTRHNDLPVGYLWVFFCNGWTLCGLSWRELGKRARASELTTLPASSSPAIGLPGRESPRGMRTFPGKLGTSDRRLETAFLETDRQCGPRNTTSLTNGRLMLLRASFWSRCRYLTSSRTSWFPASVFLWKCSPPQSADHMSPVIWNKWQVYMK